MSELQPFSDFQRDINRSAFEAGEVRSSAHWNELRTFLAVAKFMSFKRAAESLHVSHPTVSRHVKHLEQLLKTKLIVAQPNGITLTDRGEALAKRVSKIDDIIYDTEKMVQDTSSQLSGTARISITDGLAGFWLAPSLKAMMGDEHPIELHILSANNLVRFTENLSDIYVSLMPQEGSNIRCEKIGTLHLIPVVAKSYVEKHGVPTVSNLSDHQIVQMIYYDERLRLWDAWNEVRKDAALTHYSDNSVVYGMMVKAGYGVGLLGNYVLIDPDFTPLDLDVTISIPLYVTAQKDSLALRHIALAFENVCELLGPNNPWFADTLSVSAANGHWDQGFRFALNL